MEEYVYLLITEYFYDGLDDVQVFKDLEDAISFLQYNYSICDETIDGYPSVESVDNFYWDIFMCETTKEMRDVYILKKKILQ